MILIAKLILGRVWGWLQHASFWQVASICLCLVIAYQHVELIRSDHEAAKWEKLAKGLKTQLDAEIAKDKAAEQAAAAISKQIKDRTDEENRRIAGDADTLRLSGPGKAVCPGISAGPSGHIESTPKPDVAGPTLPPDERAAVPWHWLVQRSEEHDQLLNEVQAWRDWHEQVLKVWPKNTEARP